MNTYPFALVQIRLKYQSQIRLKYQLKYQRVTESS